MAQGSVDPTIKQWLIKVDQNLSLEGFFLLKALYLNDIPLATLSDRVCKPHDLCLAQRNDNGEELPKISPHHSVSLFIHRLRVLVPSRTTELRHEKDVGARACLDSLPRNLSVVSRSPGGVATAKESKLLECLVKTYVNLSPQQRLVLMRNMSESSGESLMTLFQLFEKFFSSYKNRPEAGIARFSSALQAAKSPAASAELEESLTNFGIPHYKIPIPRMDADDDVGSQELKPLIIRPVDYSRSIGKRKKRAFVCLCLAAPLVLGVILIGIGIGVVHSHIPNVDMSSTFEISNKEVVLCGNLDSDTTKLIRLGHFNTFWQESIDIHGLNDPPDTDIYIIPDNRLRIHTKGDSCTCDEYYACDDVIMEHIYLLEGSSLNLSITYHSDEESSEGHLKLAICTGFSIDSINKCQNLTRSTTSRSTLADRYVVPNDGYYVVFLEHQNVVVNSYNFFISKRYLSAEDLTKNECVTTLSSQNSYEATIFKNNNVNEMVKATGYTIVGMPVSSSTATGLLTVTKHQQLLALAVPFFVSGAATFLGLVLAVGSLLCCHVAGKIRQCHHERGGSGSRELYSPNELMKT